MPTIYGTYSSHDDPSQYIDTELRLFVEDLVYQMDKRSISHLLLQNKNTGRRIEVILGVKR